MLSNFLKTDYISYMKKLIKLIIIDVKLLRY